MAQIEILDTGTSTRINVIETGNTKTFVAPYNHIRLDALTDTFFKLQTAAGEFITQGNLGDVTNPVSLTMNDLITNTAFMFTSGGGGPVPDPVPTLEDVRSVLENIRNFQESYLRAELKKGVYVTKNYDDYIGRTLDNADIKNFNWFAVGPVTTLHQIVGPDLGLIAMHDFFNSPPTAGSILSISSDSADDTAPGGPGAIAVFIDGLDENYEVVGETINLQGLTPVPTLNQYTRINRALVVASGSTNTNVGNIRIVHPLAPAQYIAAIPPGIGFNQLGIFTVPADYVTYLMKQVIVSCDAACELIWYQRDVQNMVNNRFSTITLHLQPGVHNFPLTPPPGLPGKIDTMVTARTLAGTANVSVMVNGYFIKQPDEIDGPDTSGTAPQPFPATPQPWTVQN